MTQVVDVHWLEMHQLKPQNEAFADIHILLVDMGVT